MKTPKTPNKKQRLLGRIAVLNRFVSKSTNKCLPSATKGPQMEQRVCISIHSAQRILV